MGGQAEGRERKARGGPEGAENRDGSSGGAGCGGTATRAGHVYDERSGAREQVGATYFRKGNLDESSHGRPDDTYPS